MCLLTIRSRCGMMSVGLMIRHENYAANEVSGGKGHRD